MDFFDKLSETLVNVGNNVSQKAKDLSGSAKLTMDIHVKEDQVQKMYAEIGKKYFEAHKNESVNDEQMDRIKEALAAIEDMKKELLELKRAKVCPRCGKEVGLADAYCKSCGFKMEDDDIIVDAVVKEASSEENHAEEAFAPEEEEETIKTETTEEVFED